MPFDLLMSADGDLVFPLRPATGDALIQQRIRRRLRTFLGDWFLDPTKGLDYLSWMTQRPPPLATISARTRAAVEGTPGVQRVERWDAVIDGQQVRVTGQILLTTGQQLAVALERNEAGIPQSNASPWFLTLTELLA